ncbi:MAG: prepilin-type N-terminal cleavage/methylation domain-containing protein [Chitinispirillaceae bacterium]|nr:prepilin-type N-terminal cleavage/methylation domain-containing protein [Chitinispirillaceae bacterium]
MDVHRRVIHRNKRPASAAGGAEKTADSGFTLVEGIVAAMISSILVGVMFAFLSMNNTSVKYGAVNAKVRSQYEIAITEIGTYARRAHAVLNHEGGGETYPPGTGLSVDSTSKIMIYEEDANGAGIPIRGYCVENGEFKEWRPGWGDFQPFIVGKWPSISVIDAAPFILSSNRKTVTVSMRVSDTIAGVAAVTPARGEVFSCRN